MSVPLPRVSAVLLSYNCEQFIREALMSVLDQDYANLEIVASDDASEDDTFNVLQQTIAGVGRADRPVDLRRRSANSGSKSAHLNDVLRNVSGEIVVFFDGDDVSTAGRVARIVEAFTARSDVQAVYSAYSLIDERGRALGRSHSPVRPTAVAASSWFARVGTYASGGTLAIRPGSADAFGPLYPDIHEDITLPFRASLFGDVVFVDEDLVIVRRHPASLTQDYSAYSSVESYRKRFFLGIERARRQRDSKLEDLDVALALAPDRAGEFDALRKVVNESAADAELSAGLVGGTLWTRLRTLFRLSRSEYYVDSFFRDLSLALVPRLYLRYKLRNLEARPLREPEGSD